VSARSEGEGRLQLYDFRLRVAAMYRKRNDELHAGSDPKDVWEQFWLERSRIFASHSQSALDDEQKARFMGIDVFPYDNDLVVDAEVETDVALQRLEIPTSGEESMSMTLVGQIGFELTGKAQQLSLYWIDVYGGGLFLPFRDASPSTYGGGRYLIDTVKGSDFLPLAGSPLNHRVRLDFNYAYNPSCAYHHRWVCPLAPPGNRLAIEIEAGEKIFEDAI
jgi:uncharacterized protein (DUF1684 family)